MLERAKQVFERFRIDMEDDRDQAGAAQAFEFCVELSWKMMKRVLQSRGQEAGSPKDTLRKAADEKLISSAEVWFEFIKMRNLSSHAYDQAHLQIVVSCFDQFSHELNKLLVELKKSLP